MLNNYRWLSATARAAVNTSSYSYIKKNYLIDIVIRVSIVEFIVEFVVEFVNATMNTTMNATIFNNVKKNFFVFLTELGHLEQKKIFWLFRLFYL